jgi:hypothetical protein
MKIYEGNAITPLEDYQGKWALSPCGNVVSTDFGGKEGWSIIEPFDQPYLKYVNGELIEDIEKKQKDEKEKINKPILEQINEIEIKKIRALTDYCINNDDTFLIRYENQISELRSQLIK